MPGNHIYDAIFHKSMQMIYVAGTIQKYASVLTGFPKFVGLLDRVNIFPYAIDSSTHCFLTWNANYILPNPYTDPPVTFLPTTTLAGLQLISGGGISFTLANLNVASTTFGPLSNIYYSCHKSPPLVTLQSPVLVN